MPLLTLDVARALQRAVKEAAHEALGIGQISLNRVDTATQDELITEIRVCVEAALLDLSRSFNAEHCQLFNELWCMAWSFLPATDVVRVTHVSRRWRNIALCCPELWCKIDYRSDLHDDDCDCRLADGSSGSPMCLDGPGRCNLDMAEAFLRRSGKTLPISLTIDLLGELASRDELLRLAGALQHYIPRLVELRFLCEDPEASAVFLAHFDCFPALRTLHTHCDRLGYPADESARFLSRALRLPALRTLRIIGSLEPGGMIPHSLSSLVSLRFPFWETADILEYLETSPVLRQLRLQAPARAYAYYPPRDTLERVREVAVSRCMDVQIETMSPHCEAAILAMFDSKALSRLVLAYAEPRGLPQWTPRIESLRILQHIERIEKLSVFTRPDGEEFEELVISARDQAGKERGLIFRSKLGKPQFKYGAIWEHLSGSPTALTADSRLFWSPDFPSRILGSVKQITVLLRTSGLGIFVLMEPFTALEELILAAAGKDSVIDVTTHELLSTLDELTLPGTVLKKLVLQGVTLDGELTLLNGVAQTVLVI
ncbi:hypothetical protein AURDEDRAFT_144000, partial [Auricularia subglabra TFB-10046 SS5]